MKRPQLKRYITILLDENELEKRRTVKLKNKISDRKIYMAMVDALFPKENPFLKDNIINEKMPIPDEE